MKKSGRFGCDFWEEIEKNTDMDNAVNSATFFMEWEIEENNPKKPAVFLKRGRAQGGRGGGEKTKVKHRKHSQ